LNISLSQGLEYSGYGIFNTLDIPVHVRLRVWNVPGMEYSGSGIFLEIHTLECITFSLG
jgi:hypothetical protein